MHTPAKTRKRSQRATEAELPRTEQTEALQDLNFAYAMRRRLGPMDPLCRELDALMSMGDMSDASWAESVAWWTDYQALLEKMRRRIV
jgi:hypothetical protein